MIEFRTATIQDTQDLAKLVNSAYRGDYSKQGWTTEADLLDGQRTDAESLAELIKTPQNRLELAIDSATDKIVGSVHLIQESTDSLYFGMLTIEPTLQGQGLGKILLGHIEQEARILKIKKIRFTVIPTRTELVAFYERRGFGPTGRYEDFPKTDPRFGLPKVEGLILQEYEKTLTY